MCSRIQLYNSDTRAAVQSHAFLGTHNACFDTDSHRTTERGRALPPTPPNYFAKSFLYQNNPWSLTNHLCQLHCIILCVFILTWLANAGFRTYVLWPALLISGWSSETMGYLVPVSNPCPGICSPYVRTWSSIPKLVCKSIYRQTNNRFMCLAASMFL